MALVGQRYFNAVALVLRLAAVAGFVFVTNPGFMQRVLLLQNQGRWTTMAFFLAIWGLSLAALLIVALHRSVWVRATWAAVIATASAVGFAYWNASGTEFGAFDALSLWSARHEAARAMEFYATDLTVLVAVAAAGFLVLSAPPTIPLGSVQRWFSRLAWTPAIPVALIAAVIVIKEGGGSQALPTQFVPLSVGLVSAAKMSSVAVPQRRAVAWMPDRPKVRHVVLLVDESVRSDYIDWTPGNPFTPELARLRSRLVDFGPAASGGNCSHYANALLRLAAAPDSLGTDILSNPTIWQYAKRAGYRTVYIDAQSAFNKDPGKLQNFMTADEASDIDRLVTMPTGIPGAELDGRLLDIVVDELRSERPVFIFANKNGAHFPYDASYPESEQVFRPTVTDVLEGAARQGGARRAASAHVETASVQARINSYRNAVRWSVDAFFKRLFGEVPLDQAVILYTSDHGQAFIPDRLSHCTTDDPDPREALVPLFVAAPTPGLRERFAAGARASRGNASHFSLAPTLLELFGYSRHDITGRFGPSLFERNAQPPSFTSGDIFGLFSKRVRWHPIDLNRSYLESQSRNAVPHGTSASRAGPAILAR